MGWGTGGVLQRGRFIGQNPFFWWKAVADWGLLRPSPLLLPLQLRWLSCRNIGEVPLSNLGVLEVQLVDQFDGVLLTDPMDGFFQDAHLHTLSR